MNIRGQCVEIIQRILEEKVFFSALKSQLSEKDIPFANMLILTVLRRRIGLDMIIAQFVKKKIPEKNRVLNYVLYCGIAELLFLNTPDYAVINEYVSLAKKYAGHFASGMVNAVLRKTAQDKNKFVASWKCQLPPDFKKQVKEDYGETAVEKIASMSIVEAPLDISVKEKAPFWAEKLGGALLANGTIRLENPRVKIPALPGFKEGDWWIQDLAASLPVLTLGDVKGLKVLDLCAAPGGKTAQLLAGGAKVWAIDVDEIRMERLRENIKRLKLETNLYTEISEASQYLQTSQIDFDVILVDAPCSATGTFRRHPEVLHIKAVEDIHKQSKIQRALLDHAAKKLKIDGKILYCTCSISKAEGEQQIARFLNQYKNFELTPVSMDSFSRNNGLPLPQNMVDKGMLRTLPYYMHEIGGMDSFFAACLKKNYA